MKGRRALDGVFGGFSLLLDMLRLIVQNIHTYILTWRMGEIWCLRLFESQRRLVL